MKTYLFDIRRVVPGRSGPETNMLIVNDTTQHAATDRATRWCHGNGWIYNGFMYHGEELASRFSVLHNIPVAGKPLVEVYRSQDCPEI